MRATRARRPSRRRPRFPFRSRHDLRAGYACVVSPAGTLPVGARVGVGPGAGVTTSFAVTAPLTSFFRFLDDVVF